MDYFCLKQNQDYLNTPVIEGFYQKMRRKEFTPEMAFKIPDRNVVYCKTAKNLDFIDILDQQIFLVSDAVKHVFEMYERNITYKFFCILDIVTEKYGTYYAPIIPALDCLVKPIYRTENDIQLRKESIGSDCIFKIKSMEKEIVVIRLDVAESLLRRKLRGFKLIRMAQS